MRYILSAIALMTLYAGIVSYAHAQTVTIPIDSAFYVGKSAADCSDPSKCAIAGQGLYGLNQACKNAFGSTARIATHLEFALSGRATGEGGDAWIINQARQDLGATGGENCKGWSSLEGNGTVVDLDTGAFGPQACADLCPVACSAKLF